MNSRKTKLIIIACLCVAVLGLSIGYALLSANLNINGTAKVESKWDVVFLTGEIETTKTGTAECSIGTVSGTSIEGMSVVFNKPGDSCTFTVPVKNIGTIPAKLVDVTGKSSNLTFLGDSADQDLLRKNVTYEVNYGKEQIKGTTDFSTIPVLNEQETETVTLKATFLNSSTEMPTGEVIIGGLDRAFIYESVINGEDSGSTTPIVDNIPNPPELNGDMIPVYYDKIDDTTGEWKKADINNVNNNWYDYSKQQWANAVTVVAEGKQTRDYYKNAKAGTTINMDDINTMWVWIPRYSYTIKSEDGNNYYGKASFENKNPSQELPGEIDVKFISKVTETGTAQYTGDTPTNWRTNEAFDFGGEKRSGIWVGKFETTGNSFDGTQVCTDTKCNVGNVTIKPGVTSLSSQTVSSFFYMARSMQLSNASVYGFDKNSGDLHMIKNDEWGSVAYLSQSKYGKYGNSDYSGANKEIYQNKSSEYITGLSNGTPSQESAIESQYAYNNMTKLGDGKGQAGPGASTTGNITGIYDMSGGIWEYVMGVLAYYEDNSPMSGNSITYNSGFTGKVYQNGTYENFVNSPKELNFPDEKYYNLYKIGTSKETMMFDPNLSNSLKACNGGVCHGQALSETSGWYRDSSNYISVSYPWSRRGEESGDTTAAGIFGSYFTSGAGYANVGSRLTLTP